MIAAPIPDAIKAYSIALAPRSSARNRPAAPLAFARRDDFRAITTILVGLISNRSRLVRWAISGSAAGGIGYSRNRVGRTHERRWPSFGVTVPSHRLHT